MLSANGLLRVYCQFISRLRTVSFEYIVGSQLALIKAPGNKRTDETKFGFLGVLLILYQGRNLTSFVFQRRVFHRFIEQLHIEHMLRETARYEVEDARYFNLLKYNAFLASHRILKVVFIA